MAKMRQLRDEIRETLSELVESAEPARALQTRLLELQRTAVAKRRREVGAAGAAMRAPVRSPEVAAEAVLIGDALDAITKVLGGIGQCGGVFRNLERQDRESKITPGQRQEQVHKTRSIMAEAHSLGLLNRHRISLGLKPLKELPEDAAALAELAGATP